MWSVKYTYIYSQITPYYLHVLPGVDHFHRGTATEPHVSPPGVKVGGIWLDVLGAGTGAVGVENELVRGEE